LANKQGFMGVNVEHKIADNFMVGATYIKMSDDHTQNQVLDKSVNNTILDLTPIFY
jgi:hypothetical protein